MQQRYYDPGIGMFLSVDPVSADGGAGTNFNRYWYAFNNPYKFTDPDGREAHGPNGSWDRPDNSGTVDASEQARENVLDSLPLVGDIRAVSNAVNDPTLGNVVAAVLGLLGPVGDSAAPLARTARPSDGSSMSTNEALDAASSFLGEGYRSVANGVFRSADGTRQVRMRDSDLAGDGNHAGAPHMNFEEGSTTTKPNGKESFKREKDKNSHVYLREER